MTSIGLTGKLHKNAKMSNMNFNETDVKGIFKQLPFEPINVITWCTLWWPQFSVHTPFFNLLFDITMILGRGVGQVVSVLAFYSDEPSLNPTDAFSFSVKFVFEKNKNKQKRGRGWPIFKKLSRTLLASLKSARANLWKVFCFFFVLIVSCASLNFFVQLQFLVDSENFNSTAAPR